MLESSFLSSLRLAKSSLLSDLGSGWCSRRMGRPSVRTRSTASGLITGTGGPHTRGATGSSRRDPARKVQNGT